MYVWKDVFLCVYMYIYIRYFCIDEFIIKKENKLFFEDCNKIL